MSSWTAEGQKSFRERQEGAQKKQNGTLPPDVDEANGKMINPHNPEFITKVPWYLGDSGPTLQHHSTQNNSHELSMNEQDDLIQRKIEEQRHLKRESKKGGKIIAFRKGACKNCGSMSHKERDCLERPRSKAKSAYKTGITSSHDDVTMKLEDHGKINYAAKRDAWKGYDATKFSEVVEKFQIVEEERNKRKLKEIEETKKKNEDINNNNNNNNNKKKSPENSKNNNDEFHWDSDLDDDDDNATKNNKGISNDDEYRLKDEDAVDFQGRHARQGGVGGAQMKTTVRNLRIREDVPKYLRNLDLNGAFYDPKTRSMRANPNPNLDPEQAAFAGDNFVRHTGDAVKLAQAQVLCWDMESSGVAPDSAAALDIIANPSAAERAAKIIEEKKSEVLLARRSALFEKYGTGGAIMEGKAPKDNNTNINKTIINSDEKVKTQTIEYNSNSHGIVSRIPKTKYDEDVCPGNHTSVWGSYWSRASNKWGYSCCHQLIYNSYCIGEKGRLIAKADDEQDKHQIEQQYQHQQQKNRKTTSDLDESSRPNLLIGSALYGEAPRDLELDSELLKEAMLRQESKEHNTSNSESGKRGRKQTYDSILHTDVTAEDMEAWRIKRSKPDDPIHRISSDTLLPLDDKK